MDAFRGRIDAERPVANVYTAYKEFDPTPEPHEKPEQMLGLMGRWIREWLESRQAALDADATGPLLLGAQRNAECVDCRLLCSDQHETDGTTASTVQGD